MCIQVPQVGRQADSLMKWIAGLTAENTVHEMQLLYKDTSKFLVCFLKASIASCVQCGGVYGTLFLQ